MGQIGDKCCGVPGGFKGFGEGDILKKELVPAGKFDAVLLEVEVGGEDAAARVKLATEGDGGQAFRVKVLEYDRFFGELVQVRGLYPMAPVSLKVVGTKCIRNEHDQVKLVARLFRRLVPMARAGYRTLSCGGSRGGGGL